MTTELFKSIYITMRIYKTIIETKSITWTNSRDLLNAFRWASYCSEGYEHVLETVYAKEFLDQCQMIREFVSVKDIPSDFIPNAYAYLLHAIFCRTDNLTNHRELALCLFSSNVTSVNSNSYRQLLTEIKLILNPRRAFSNANRCLLEALVTLTMYLPKHFEFLFDLLHDMNQYEQLCLLILETIFKRSDLSSSYDCLLSMKIERIFEIFNEATYGAYVIVKLILKNRLSFVKGLKTSLTWHTNVFKKFPSLFTNSNYEPIRAILIEICHDSDIQSVLMEDLF